MVDELAQVGIGGRDLAVLLRIGLALRCRLVLLMCGHLLGQPFEVTPVRVSGLQVREQLGKAAGY